LQSAPLPNNEFRRTQSLRALNILDSTSDIRFDLITHYASHLFNAPICTISLIDTSRQWFKSAYGVEHKEIPRSIAMCAHAIYLIQSNNPQNRILEVNDTLSDFRFADNPLVTEAPYVRSYMSYVIQSDNGDNIGTICIADNQLRTFTAKEKRSLISLGEMSERLIRSYPSHTISYSNHSTTQLPKQ